jgi:cold shock CspA family protein
MSTRRYGELRRWFDDKGYGFLTDGDSGGNDLFVHVTEFFRAGIEPQIDARYSYDVGPGKKPGTRAACDIQRAAFSDDARGLPAFARGR